MSDELLAQPDAESQPKRPEKRWRVRTICVLLAAIFYSISVIGDNGWWQTVTASIFDAALFGMVVAGLAVCFPGNRIKNAKGAFDGTVVIIAALMIGAEITKPTPQSVSASDTEQLRHEAKAYEAETMQLANQYNAQMNAIWGNGILKPENLDTKEKIVAARSKVEQSEKLGEEFEKQICSLIESCPDRLQAIPIDNSSKSSLVGACRVKAAATLATAHAIFDTNRQFHATVLDELNFLESRLGHFEIQNGIILFENDTDLQTYNSDIGLIKQQAGTCQHLLGELSSPIDNKELEEFWNG